MQDKPIEAGFRDYGTRFRRTMTGEISFTTIKPGAVPGPDGKMQAPHIGGFGFYAGIIEETGYADLFSE